MVHHIVWLKVGSFLEEKRMKEPLILLICVPGESISIKRH